MLVIPRILDSIQGQSWLLHVVTEFSPILPSFYTHFPRLIPQRGSRCSERTGNLMERDHTHGAWKPMAHIP